MILDCTLRDGAHVNKGYFGKENIAAIVTSLIQSKVDFIEVGFVENCEYDDERSFFPDLKTADEFCSNFDFNNFSVMIRSDRLDFEKLNHKSSSISLIRIAFYPEHIEDVVKYTKRLNELGYEVFLNPINVTAYQAQEYKHLISNIVNIDIKGIALVDTFGALSFRSFYEYLDILKAEINNLNIKIGLHLHENTNLSLGLLESVFYKYKETDFIVDASLFGMGRIPGNLHLENIMTYYNVNFETNYNLKPIFKVIEEIIFIEYRKRKWGYSPIYMYAGHNNIHRTYAEYMKEELGLSFVKIIEVLDLLKDSHCKYEFNKEYLLSKI